MRTTNYEDILLGALALAGLPQADPPLIAWNRFRTWMDQHFTSGAQEFYFPELERIEKRTFRADYSAATAYTNDGTIIYFIQEEQYYQPLKATTGNPPADSLGVVDDSRWALAETSYTASDYSSATAYVAGDQVFYPTNGLYYQCHTASTGNAPTNTSYWGVLTAFDRYVDYEQTGQTELGEVLEVWDADPDVSYGAEPVAYRLSENGVQILRDLPYVWIQYRVRLSAITGDAWDSATAYSVGNQVYYRTSTTRGNFYACVSATSAGESPASAAAKWSVVEIPLVLKNYLVRALYSEWLAYDGQTEKSVLEMQRAKDLLAGQVELLAAQQQQGQRTVVVTR